MTSRADLHAFISERRMGVVATHAPSGAPESAVVGLAATLALELIFDTLATTRKVVNIRSNPHVSVVVGWTDEGTLQYEGMADEPAGDDLERVRRVYFEAFPDGPGRLAWTDLTYVRIRPSWLRFTSYDAPSRNIEMIF